MSTHAHPMVSKSDVASLNAAHAPWQIVKSFENVNPSLGAGSRKRFYAVAHNVETGEVIYRCEGWSNASRGQALNAILDREAADHDAAGMARHLADIAPKSLATDLAEQGLTVADLARADVIADVLLAGWTYDDICNARCTSDDPANHQGDTCPVHESAAPAFIPAPTFGDNLPSVEGDGIAYHGEPTADDIAEATREERDTRTAWNVLHDATEGDVSNQDMTEVVAWCREWARDVQWLELDSEEVDKVRASVLLKSCNRHIEGGLAFVLADVRRVRNDARQGIDRNCPACRQGLSWDGTTQHTAGCPDAPEELHEQSLEAAGVVTDRVRIAAKIARDAAGTWQWDAGSEDVEDAATRALDIFRDLSSEDRVSFVAAKLAPYLVAELLGRL